MRIKNIIRVVILGPVFLGLSPGGSVAAENTGLRIGVKVEINGAHSGPIRAAGAEVVMAGSTPRNASLIGAVVRFEGRVGDDLWAIGADLGISGEITKNLHVWGAKILLNSFVGGKVSLTGAEILIGENAAISKKTHASGDKVVFKGAAIGMVDIEGREVVFSGSARSGLSIRAPSVKITENARITGDVTIHTIGTPEISRDARISGEVKIESLPRWEAMRRAHEGGVASRIALAVIVTLCTFLTGLVTISLARAGVETTVDMLVEQPGRCVLWGLIGLITIPVIAAILTLTVLGAPLAAALIMTMPLILLLSLTGSGFAVGEWIFNRTGDNVTAMQRAMSLLAGLLLIAFLSIMPYIGGLIITLALVIGAGGLFLLFKDRFGKGTA